MLRESNMQSLTWADKTMSVLKERQLEACENRLASLPAFGLFNGCTDQNVEELYAISYDAMEHPVCHELHTVRSLTHRVRTNLVKEAALLSTEEHLLLDRLIALGGDCELMDWEETSAAESLVRRLWCTISRKSGRIFLHLPMELLSQLLLVVSLPTHEELREKLYQYETTLHGLLYLGGMLHYAEPLHRLMEEVLRSTDAYDKALAMRYLRCSFDYTYDRRGDMLLLHPGLAEPERLSGALRTFAPTAVLDEETLRGAVMGLLPGEQPLFEQMFGLIHGVVRPEITGEQAVEDLMMLAKQGVSLTEMNEVLSTLVTIQPTADMYAGVRQIYLRTPRWGSLSTAMVQ